MTKKQKKVLYQIIAAVILIVILKLLPAFPTPVELVLYLIPYLVVGWDVLRKALKGIKNRQPFDECFLMAPEHLQPDEHPPRLRQHRGCRRQAGTGGPR